MEESSQNKIREESQKKSSVFEEIGKMDVNSALGILIQASISAQKAGALSMKDSIYVGAAIELLTKNPL